MSHAAATRFVGRMSSVGLALAAIGCSPTYRIPRLLSPGSAPLQRHNATQFDPYPPNDLAPEISGGRPIDFLQPRNEVVRSRQYRNGEVALATPGRAPALNPFTPTPIGPPTPIGGPLPALPPSTTIPDLNPPSWPGSTPSYPLPPTYTPPSATLPPISPSQPPPYSSPRY